MKPRVIWQGVPREYRAAIEPFVRKYLPALPCWVGLLTVNYNQARSSDSAETVLLAASGMEEYREVTLHCQPEWMELDETERDWRVSHEFSHFPTLPVADLIDDILKDANAPKALVRQWERRLEAATQDISRILRDAYG